jgi:predicted NBD/HSP70 family sugar kinase
MRAGPLVKDLVRRIARIRREHPAFGECVGIGVVVSGVVDLESGRFEYSPTLGWRDVDPREPLEAATKLPVVIENSVKACMLAQVWALGGGEITAAWDLIEATVRESLRELALVAEAGETEIRTVPLGEHPRLRGAAALVSTPAFAAPIVA